MNRVLREILQQKHISSKAKDFLDSTVSCQKRSIRTTAPLNEGPVDPHRLPSTLRAPVRRVTSDNTVSQLHEAEVARLVALLTNLSPTSNGGLGSATNGSAPAASACDVF